MGGIRHSGGFALASSMFLAALVLPATALAGPKVDARFSAAALGDVAFAPALHGHGALMLGVDLEGEAIRGHVVFDTETIRGGVDGIALAERLWLGFDARAEFGYAALLPDYFEEGHLHPELGIAASYFGGGTALTWSPGRRHWVRATVGARYWWFGRLDDTAESFRLPEDRPIGEAALGYTFWSIHNGDDFSERHRAYPRVDGSAAEIGVRAWFGGGTPAWGFGSVRNGPDPVAARPYLHLRAGTRLHDRLRWQVDHRAAWGFGEDDITRDRVGGGNRYVVPLVGAPWGAFASERYLSGEWSWHVHVAGDSEAGLLLDGVLIDDARRTGESAPDFHVGTGIFADLRFGDWQVDARVGITPTVHRSPSQTGVSALLGVGWGEPARR